MITNHTTRTGKNGRSGDVTGPWTPMAVGMILAVIGALLIVAVLLASGAGTLPFRFSSSDGTSVQTAGHSPNISISSAGSAHDGSAYVQYLLTGPAAQPLATNPNVPITGTGSAHDGSAYVQYLLTGPATPATRPLATNPNVPITGTGSAYNGGN